MKRLVQSIISIAALFAVISFASVTATAQTQSGYWAQVVAVDATIRARPVQGSRVLKTLTRGQWFHVYPTYKDASWFVGYACVNGNRGCANQQSTSGFILRGVLSGKVAMNFPTVPRRAGEASFVGEIGDPSLATDSRRAHVYRAIAADPAATWLAPAPSNERRICAREAWMRDDRLRPIELLRAGDRFIVEKYTDGSKNDGYARWAIGRAKNLRGRVLLTALCK
jgi:hypothetical protein